MRTVCKERANLGILCVSLSSGGFVVNLPYILALGTYPLNPYIRGCPNTPVPTHHDIFTSRHSFYPILRSFFSIIQSHTLSFRATIQPQSIVHLDHSFDRIQTKKTLFQTHTNTPTPTPPAHTHSQCRSPALQHSLLSDSPLRL
jgi:hypothetical protein